MKALIVEDEPRARRVLENLLRTHFPEVEIVALTSSVKETVAWLAENRTDVIFMDVELADGNCFDIFAAAKVDAQVVMITAYDNYAVKAFEVNSVDYLLKPVEVEELRRAVERVKDRLGKADSIDIQQVLEAFRKMQGGEEDTVSIPVAGRRREKFLIRLNDRIVPVRTAEIAYFYSEDKNSYLVTLAGSSYVLDESLDAIAGSLNPSAFFRISRGCIISEGVIDSVSRLVGGRLRISLRRDIPTLTDFTVSRARVDDFLTWLER